MMDVFDLMGEGFKLFNEEKYAEAIKKLHQAWDWITDKRTQIKEQREIQAGLGRCYFEQAMKIKNTDKVDELFGQAVEHYREWLQLARSKQLVQGQTRIQEISAQSWIGGCYLEQAKKTKDMDKAAKLFKQAAALFKRQLQLAGQLENEQIRIQQQIFARFGLGRCYIERVRRIRNTDKAEALFKKQAGKHLLAADGQLSQLRDEADDEQLSQLSDEAEKKGMEKRIRQSLRDIDYLNEEWDSYFGKKKQEIQESLFKGKTSQPQDAVSTVLAVLHITPIELGFTPMAH